MSVVYFLSRFSQEALLVELFLIGCLMTAYFGFLLVKRRRYGIAKKNIPDNVVRALLVEMISQAEGFKRQLFGESFKIEPGQGLKLTVSAEAPAAIAPTVPAASDTATSAELSLLKKQLTHAESKVDELSKSNESLAAEKSSLESKLAQTQQQLQQQASSAAKSAAAPASASNEKALLEKIAKLEAKLSEYEVIEDDLANLKHYQQENKRLREQLAALQGGAAAAAVPTAPEEKAPAAEPGPAAAAEPVTAEPSVAADVAPEPAIESPPAPSAPEASPLGASVTDPLVGTAKPSEPAPQPAAAGADAPAAAPKPPGGKSDVDLLNEFERMLNS